jgi:hypothetical protein
MADADGDNAAKEVQILISIRVPYVLILGVVDHQRFLVIVKDGWEQMVAIGEENVFFRHA